MIAARGKEGREEGKEKGRAAGGPIRTRRECWFGHLLKRMVLLKAKLRLVLSVPISAVGIITANLR